MTLEIIIKYGFDGSGSHSLYGMKVNEMSSEVAETQMFASFICPIRVICKETKAILWQNPVPSSPVYCRPLRIKFAKETKELIRSEHNSIESEIQDLTPTIEGDITVHYTLIPTMVDGKVCQALSNTPSSSSCFLCQPVTKPSQMNKINEIKGKEVSREYLKYSISPLHLLINTMECVLHIAYRLDLKVWSVKGKESKSIMLKEKERIQSAFKKEVGINVDFPSQGSGNTNNGNAARKFFSDPVKCSLITGVDEELNRRFSVLLFTLNSGYNINAKTYEVYAEETAKRYKDLYNWYYMPVSVQKILMHGSHIIEALCIPIGHASEEGIEARHKDLRSARLHHTCKSSRTRVNNDLIHWLLATSDPVVATSQKPRSLRKYNSLSPDIRSLLDEPKIEEYRQTSTHSDDDDEHEGNDEEEDDDFI